jgi:AcrR family transcriptional regulator
VTENQRLTAEERRDRIFEAAVEAFAEKRYRATSVREISATAGITQPVFYDHFASKRALFETIIIAARDELIDAGTETMRRDAPAQERVREAVDQFFRFVEEKPALARVLLIGAEGAPELETLDRAVQQEASEQIAVMLWDAMEQEGRPPGEDDRFTMQVEFIKLGIHGLAEWWWDNPDTPRELLVETVMDVCWFGMRESFEERS